MYDKCSDCEYGDVENLRLENQELKKQYEEYIRAEIKLKDELEKQREVIDKAILELANIDGNLSNSQLSDRICNLIDILSEVK